MIDQSWGPVIFMFFMMAIVVSTYRYSGRDGYFVSVYVVGSFALALIFIMTNPAFHPSNLPMWAIICLVVGTFTNSLTLLDAIIRMRESREVAS